MSVKIYIDNLFFCNLFFNYLIIDVSCWYVKKELTGKTHKVVLIACNSLVDTIVTIILLNLCILGKERICIYIQFIFPFIMSFLSSAYIIRCINAKTDFGNDKLSVNIICKLSGIMIIFSFLFAGIIEYMYRKSSFVNSYIVVYLFIILLAERFIKRFLGKITRILNKQKMIVHAVIKYKGIAINAEGLIDSGNSLVEPVTGKPVSIIEAKKMNELGMQKIDKLFCVPYKSVGQEYGTIYAIEVEEMIMCYEEEMYVIQKPIIGIYKGKLSADDSYEMIINNAYIASFG